MSRPRQVRVPRSDWPAVQLLLSLSKDSFSKFSDDLIALAPTRGQSNFRALLPALSDISADNAIILVDFMMNLTMGALRNSIAPDEMVEYAANYFDLEKPKDFPGWNKDEWQKHSESLIKLVSASSPIFLMSKARVLVTEYPRLIIKSQSLTDIRYLFDNDGARLNAAVIAHSLAFEVHDGERDHTTLYLSLDTEDIDVLLEQLTRAKKKEEAIRKSLSDCDVIDLTPCE